MKLYMFSAQIVISLSVCDAFCLHVSYCCLFCLNVAVGVPVLSCMLLKLVTNVIFTCDSVAAECVFVDVLT